MPPYSGTKAGARGELPHPLVLAHTYICSLFRAQTRQSCDNLNLVPLLRAYSSKQTDHFYTTDVQEMQHAIAKDSYRPRLRRALPPLEQDVHGSLLYYVRV